MGADRRDFLKGLFVAPVFFVTKRQAEQLYPPNVEEHEPVKTLGDNAPIHAAPEVINDHALRLASLEGDWPTYVRLKGEAAPWLRGSASWETVDHHETHAVDFRWEELLGGSRAVAGDDKLGGFEDSLTYQSHRHAFAMSAGAGINPKDFIDDCFKVMEERLS